MPPTTETAERVRSLMETNRPHPSHICLECGALVSSEHDWPAVHARWHSSVRSDGGSVD